jgi:parallel beta-helix repeat protein
MFAMTARRSLVVAAIVSTGLGAGAAVAVQASASGGSGGAPARAKMASAPLSPAVLATNAHCGQTLTASLTLNGDLQCSGAGLIVTGNSVVLNLGGHTIYGPSAFGNFDGVQLSGKSDTVQNGLITGFRWGVAVYGTTDTVLNVRANRNNVGIQDYGSGTKVTTCTATANIGHGIYQPTSATVTYSGNHELNNGVNGLSAGGKAAITSNVANGNKSYGIYVNGPATLAKNTANFNGLDGIYVQEAVGIDGAGNTAKGNDYASGAVPEQCYGLVCS